MRKIQIEVTSEYNNHGFICYLEQCINRECVVIVSRDAFNYKSQKEQLEILWLEFCNLHQIGSPAPDAIQGCLNYGSGVNK